MEWMKSVRQSTALLIGVLGSGSLAISVAQDETAPVAATAKPAGVVRLSDQRYRAPVRPVSFDQAPSCTQCGPGCATGACANGACANGVAGAGPCKPSAGCQCARGACHCGPNGCHCGEHRHAAAGTGHCPPGSNGCRPYKYNLYSFHDLGDDMFGWAGYDSGHRYDQHYPYSAHCRGNSWIDDQADMFFARNKQNSDIFCAHLHGKFAYFTPMGNGGEGVPPFGCYHLVYAANPNYVDPRDAGLYAAQGWGVPMAVPLAPTVRHTMNYSAGMPASRLTPISNVLPPRRR